MSSPFTELHVYRPPPALFNVAMGSAEIRPAAMGIYEIRRANLRLLLNEAGSRGVLIERTGKSESQISQLLGDKTMGTRLARDFESAFGKDAGWMDREHIAGHPEEEDYEYANKVRGPKLSAGSGRISFQHEEVDRSHAFHKDWLRKKGIRNISRLKILDVVGDSMYPKLEDGMVVGVHLDDRTIRSNKIYALVVDGEERIKRLYKNTDGTLELRSDNPDKTRYPTEVLTPDKFDRLVIIGRMVWYAGED